MKTGTDSKLKFKHLQRDLDLPLWQARGLLDTLWEFVRCNCPRGDIGKFTDDDIAAGIDYRGDASQLIAVLVNRKWLDVSEQHRLIVHDWPQHAEDSVHRKLARDRQFFADGSKPNLGRLEKSYKDEAEKFYATTTYEICVPSAQNLRTVCVLPNHTEPEPEPSRTLPSPNHDLRPADAEPVRDSGSWKYLTAEVVQDPERFDEWIEAEVKRPDALVPDSEHGRQTARALREKAVASKDIRDVVAFIKGTLKRGIDEASRFVRGCDDDAVRRTRSERQVRKRGPPVEAAVKRPDEENATAQAIAAKRQWGAILKRTE